LKKLVLALGLIVLFLAVVVAAQLWKEYVIPTTGQVDENVELSIKWLNNSAVQQISWGPVPNGTAYQLPDLINVTNIENTPVTLQLSTVNPSPSIISLSLTWNYTDTVLQRNDWIILQLTQTVTATGPYSYDTVIRGTQS